MKLSVIIPCYNEEQNVSLFYEEFSKAFKDFKAQYELIFINDGSKDNTYLELKKLCEGKKDNIKVINFSRNFGKEAAMYAGLKESCGDYVSIIDADLQQRPEIILEMVKYLDENEDYDSVCAFQDTRSEGRVLKFFKNSFYGLINRMTNIKFVRGASDFRTFRRSVCDAMIEMGEYNRFLKGIFSFVGFNTYYIPYKACERVNGTSKWNFKSLFKYAIDGIIAFTTSPLKLGIYLGSLMIIGAIVYLIVALLMKIKVTVMMLFFLLTMFSGINLLVLGVMCEYISRMYLEIKKRPIYIIKNKLQTGKKR